MPTTAQSSSSATAAVFLRRNCRHLRSSKATAMFAKFFLCAIVNAAAISAAAAQEFIEGASSDLSFGYKLPGDSYTKFSIPSSSVHAAAYTEGLRKHQEQVAAHQGSLPQHQHQPQAPLARPPRQPHQSQFFEHQQNPVGPPPPNSLASIHDLPPPVQYDDLEESHPPPPSRPHHRPPVSRPRTPPPVRNYFPISTPSPSPPAPPPPPPPTPSPYRSPPPPSPHHHHRTRPLPRPLRKPKRSKKLVRKVLRKKKPFQIRGPTHPPRSPPPLPHRDDDGFVPSHGPVDTILTPQDNRAPPPPHHGGGHSGATFSRGPDGPPHPSRFDAIFPPEAGGEGGSSGFSSHQVSPHQRPGPPYNDGPPPSHGGGGGNQHHINFINPSSGPNKSPPPAPKDDFFKPTFSPHQQTGGGPPSSAEGGSYTYQTRFGDNSSPSKRHRPSPQHHSSGEFPQLLGDKPAENFFDNYDFASNDRDVPQGGAPPPPPQQQQQQQPHRPRPQRHSGHDSQQSTQYFHLGKGSGNGPPSPTAQPYSPPPPRSHGHHRQHSSSFERPPAPPQTRTHQLPPRPRRPSPSRVPRHSRLPPPGNSGENFFSLSPFNGGAPPKSSSSSSSSNSRGEPSEDDGFMPITNPYEFIPDELQKRLLLERRSDEMEVTQEGEDSQFSDEDDGPEGRTNEVQQSTVPSSCLDPQQAKFLQRRYPQCAREIPQSCSEDDDEESEDATATDSFGRFGLCLAETEPEVRALSLLANDNSDDGAGDQRGGSFLPRDDDECTWMVRSVFSDCAPLVRHSCSSMKRDRQRALPVLGCLFARYGDMVDLLLKEEEVGDEEGEAL